MNFEHIASQASSIFVLSKAKWELIAVASVHSTHHPSTHAVHTHPSHSNKPPQGMKIFSVCDSPEVSIPIHQMQREEKEARWVSVEKQRNGKRLSLSAVFFAGMKQAKYKGNRIKCCFWGEAVCVKSIKSTSWLFKINWFFSCDNKEKIFWWEDDC